MRPVLTGGSSRANLHTRGPRYHRPGVHPSVAPVHAHRHVANHEGRRVMSMPKRGAVTTAMLLATLLAAGCLLHERMIDWSRGKARVTRAAGVIGATASGVPFSSATSKAFVSGE